LEYQGETHYFSSNVFGKASDRQRADQLKLQFATQIGITLLSVPFWWDNSASSLASTIVHYRPDIIIPSIPATLPIPLSMPLKFRKGVKYTPNSSKDYSDLINPIGW
jgi:hypothetical protein